MSHLINFRDAVDASKLDPNARDAVYYMDGEFANEAEVRARCPHARLHAITVRGATGPHVFACDSELGDLTIPQTVAWTEEQVKLNVHPIVDYADQDRWLNQGLLKELAHYGNRIERWDADYDGSPSLPAWASAKQYADGSADLDVARAAFFGDPATGTAQLAATYDLSTGHWTIRNLPANVELGERDDWASALVQFNVHTGRVRVTPRPWNATA